MSTFKEKAFSLKPQALSLKPQASSLLANRRGVALLMVLAVITLLVPLVLESGRRVFAWTMSTQASVKHGQLAWTAKAGVQAAMAMLSEDRGKGEFDTIQEDWAREDKIAELLGELGFAGELSVAITDCLGKLQVNALVSQPNGKSFVQDQLDLWDRFLRPLVTAHENMPTNATMDILNAMKDWMDSQDDDAITGLNGAETYYYQDLSPPYRARNGLILDQDELLLVKGITPELYHGADPIPGIEPFITVHGMGAGAGGKMEYPGKINLSTAPFPVVRALLPPGSEDLAENIVAFREEKSGEDFVNDITTAGWYKNAPGCSEVDIKADLVTTQSDTFRIEASATEGDAKTTVTVWVQREKAAEGNDWTCRVLDWRTQ